VEYFLFYQEGFVVAVVVVAVVVVGDEEDKRFLITFPRKRNQETSAS